jgi:hypothetical protein
MAEKQYHGFAYEKKWCKDNNIMLWKDYVKKYKVDSDGLYTSKWDAIDEKNIDIPYQIKIVQINGGIEFGDLFRNNNVCKDFFLVVGVWETDKTNIIQEYIIYVDYKKWKKLFECKDEKFYDDIKYWIKNTVKNTKDYDEKWKKERGEYKERWGVDNILQPRFKRDHKKQRRIQCGISYNNFIEHIINNKLIDK